MNSKVDRRSFIKSSAASAVSLLGALPSMDSVGAAERNRSNLVIIDTHTHFYDPTRPQGVPWPGKDDRVLYRTVLPKDYRALITPSPVRGTVVVEASSWLEDNQWILDLAAEDKFIVGFVGNLTPGTKDFGAHLRRFTKNRLFRGIRIGGGKLGERLNNPDFIRDLHELANHDLSLDVLGGPEILSDTAKLAATVPSLRIVVDHVANVRIDGKAPPSDWQSGIRSAARNKNVFCKVSGLVEGTGRTNGDAPANTEFYRPVIDFVWDAFGEDRVIYGGNWPVSERFAKLATVQQIMMDFCSTKSWRAQRRFFADNAKRAYKWVSR